MKIKKEELYWTEKVIDKFNYYIFWYKSKENNLGVKNMIITKNKLSDEYYENVKILVYRVAVHGFTEDNFECLVHNFIFDIKNKNIKKGDWI